MHAGFLIGFATIVVLDVIWLSSEKPFVMSTEWVVRQAIANAVPEALIGSLWSTACWWGLYLRYAWSNLGNWPPKLDDNASGSADVGERGVRDRLIAHCASAPMRFFIVILLVSISLTVFGLSLMSDSRY
jgi:hypothetical protein